MSMIDCLENYVENPICHEIKRLQESPEDQKIFIYGCGSDGIRDKRVIERCGINVDLFIQSDDVKEI